MKTKEIKITNGAFCSGNCSDCLYANFRDTDSYGRVRCNGGYGGFDYQGIWRYSGEGGYDGMGVYRSPGEGGYDSKGIFRDGFEGWSVICT